MTADRRLLVAALLAVIAALLLPLLLVDVPPLLDYPNRLARSYVLAFGAPGRRAVAGLYAALGDHSQSGDGFAAAATVVCAAGSCRGHIVIGLAALLPVFGTTASRAVFGVHARTLAAGIVAGRL